jgi:hypothetical protein
MIVIHEFSRKLKSLRPISKYHYSVYIRGLRRTMKNLRVAGFQVKIWACELPDMYRGHNNYTVWCVMVRSVWWNVCRSAKQWNGSAGKVLCCFMQVWRWHHSGSHSLMTLRRLIMSGRARTCRVPSTDTPSHHRYAPYHW